MPIASSEDVRKFISLCQLIAPNNFYFANRPENASTVRELGLNNKNIKEIILSLTEENYSDGPCPDRNYKGDDWIFGIAINGNEIYIKLTISSYNDPGDKIATLFCISFHKAKQKIKYPYKKKITIIGSRKK
jgi:hypothetical protein